MIEWLGSLPHGSVVEWRRALLSLLLAFGLAQGIAAIYMLTFRGLSYSRTVVQSMAMGSIITCMLMLAVGTNIAAGLGIAGGITAVRFRTTMRDTRDIVFIFASLAVGMASGAQAYGTAITGAAVFTGAAVLLHFTGYGAHRQPDGLLRFTAPATPEAVAALSRCLREHCRTFALVTLREGAQGKVMEHAYQISAPSSEARLRLVESLRAVQGIEDVTLMLQEPTLDL